MKPDPAAMKLALKKREAELHKIITQMKQDKLQQSTVFRNLENELEKVKDELSSPRDTTR